MSQETGAKPVSLNWSIRRKLAVDPAGEQIVSQVEGIFEIFDALSATAGDSTKRIERARIELPRIESWRSTAHAVAIEASSRWLRALAMLGLFAGLLRRPIS